MFWVNLRKQPTFGDATTGFPPNDAWETSAEIPYWWRVTFYVDLDSASDWLKQISLAPRPIKISTLVPQNSFREEIHVGCFLRLVLKVAESWCFKVVFNMLFVCLLVVLQRRARLNQNLRQKRKRNGRLRVVSRPIHLIPRMKMVGSLLYIFNVA